MVTPYVAPTTGSTATSSGESAPGSLPVTGPNTAGLNPSQANGTVAPTNIPTPGPGPTSLSEEIASQILPGGPEIPGHGATPPTPEKNYDEQQLISELAKKFGIKGKDNLEQEVIDALAKDYGVKVPHIPTQSSGGGLRHDIAHWFDQARAGLTNNLNTDLTLSPPPPTRFGDRQKLLEGAQKIKSPELRRMAIEQANGTSPMGQVQQAQQQPQSKLALSDMLGDIGEKLGINTSVEGQSGVQEILGKVAGQEGLPTSTPATVGLPGTSGTQQTAGEAYVAFTKVAAGAATNAQDKSQLQQWTTDLENAGFLDKNENNTSPTVSQVASAYQQLLTTAVTQKKSVQAVLQAGPTAAGQQPAAAGSEMEAYVSGVATEFGVALSQQQLTDISNQFGAQATTAADPSSVEDQIKDAVVALYNPEDPNNPAGVANTMYTDIQQQALAYQIPISKAAIGNMVKSALQGATVESMYVAADAAESKATELFQQQAQGLYPSLGPQIAAGQTVQNLVQPYFQIAEAYTGVPSSTMMADNQGGGVSKWAKFLQGGTDAKTGAPTMQTLDQWKKTLMQDPVYGFNKTQGAKDMAEQLSTAILNEFGRVNTGGPQQALNNYSPQSALEANTT